MTDEELKQFGKMLDNYCKKYLVPTQHVFEILNDQKVTPMIRGKAMEYNAYIFLDAHLNKNEWVVQKLNLNAQPGMPDEDIDITHRRTGIIIKVESKSAVRASFSSGKRSKIHKVPHFNVKCHRSRSNIKLAGTSNDRYGVNVFDVILTTPLNALFKKGTIGEELEIIDQEDCLKILGRHYDVAPDNTEGLLNVVTQDWRFVVTTKIAEGGFIPRTPPVLLEDDPNWISIDQIEPQLLEIVERRRRAHSRR
jgi:hypothetical protein